MALTDEEKMRQAAATHAAMIRTLDTRDWKYENFDDHTIKATIKGEDLPIEFFLRVNSRQLIVSFISFLPFKVPEDKRVDAAVAVCVANDGLNDGSFDYDIDDGSISYRLTTSFRDSILGDDVFEYMIFCAAGTIDDYNDRFFALSKGMMTIDQFIQKEKESRS